MPQTIVKSTGNAIQAIKFVDKDSNELLLVFMSHGQVVLLNTLSEQFIQ